MNHTGTKKTNNSRACFALLLSVSCFLMCTVVAEDAGRVRPGLQVLYDFSSTGGPLVNDRSGVDKPLNLHIDNPKAIQRSEGSLEVRGKTLIRSDGPALKIIEAVMRSGELTLEAWIKPANTKLKGPARMVTLSRNTSERNFTLGQDLDKFDMRLRTTGTSSNGIPSLSSTAGSLTPKLTHVVYTRQRSGIARLYLNGSKSAEKQIKGNLSNWNGSFRLGLANELSNDRPWQGTYQLVAVYSRALTPGEVIQNFKAGATSKPESIEDQMARVFEAQVAPLLARHCLECHDTPTRKGGWDFSLKETAFALVKDKRAIVPGKSGESLFWKSIESDEMPKKRTPLSKGDKKLIRLWIDAGAPWSLDFIDPADYSQHVSKTGNWVRRLTVREYIETVRVAVGVDISKEARGLLPADLRADGFSNTAYNLNVDLKHVHSYARLAEMIVNRMDVVAFARKFSRSQKLIDKDMRALIAQMGKWLLRGPLQEYEVVTYRGITTTVASAGGDFKEATTLVIEAMLQSPRFIYRIENQVGDGTPWPVSDHELASRMSYILWGGPPDKELMRAADASELTDPAKVEAQVQRMLKDPRAVERSTHFIHEWLDLGRVKNLQPDKERFPQWNKQLAADMRKATITFFKEVVWKQKRPMTDLLNAQVTFASPRLAKHYGLPADAGTQTPADKTMLRYNLKSTPGRGGLLTQASVLTMGGDDASMVTRGLFVMHDLLRGVVKEPPPCVDTTPVATRPGLTQRSISEARLADRRCGGCHSKFEPLAFGLEKFDGIGAYHEKDEHGNALRDDGEILFPGQPKPITYKSSTELMNLLAGSDRVSKSLTWKLTQFALGRPLGGTDARIVGQIHKRARKAGGTYESRITAIVMSDLVRKAITEPAE